MRPIRVVPSLLSHLPCAFAGHWAAASNVDTLIDVLCRHTLSAALTWARQRHSHTKNYSHRIVTKLTPETLSFVFSCPDMSDSSELIVRTPERGYIFMLSDRSNHFFSLVFVVWFSVIALGVRCGQNIHTTTTTTTTTATTEQKKKWIIKNKRIKEINNERETTQM